MRLLVALLIIGAVIATAGVLAQVNALTAVAFAVCCTVGIVGGVFVRR